MNLELEILRILEGVYPFTMGPTALANELALRHGAAGHSPLPSQIDTALRELDSKKNIHSIQTEDRGTQHKISDHGRIRLQAAS